MTRLKFLVVGLFKEGLVMRNAVELAVPLLLGALLFVMSCGNGVVESCEDIQCPQGQTCYQGACFGGDESCDPQCLSGEICDEGRCISAEGTCDYQGQACPRSRFGTFSDGYLCMDWVMGAGTRAQCSQDCSASSCPGGEACFLVTVQGRSCTDDNGCTGGQFCYQGACAFAACRPSECSTPGGLDQACGTGSRCEAVGGTNLCVPAGEKQVGEGCIPGGEAYEEDRFSEACVEAASCVGGICRRLCTGNECESGEECVQGSQGISICAETCTPGSSDCGEKASCIPTPGVGGVCQPAGTTPLFASCSAAGEPCVSGATCALEESGSPFGRCLPICDLSAGLTGSDGELSREAQQARDQTCPQPPPSNGYLALWHLAEEAGAFDLYINDEPLPLRSFEGGELGLEEAGFEELSPGRISFALRQRGSTATDLPAADGEVTLGSGQRRLLVLVPRPGEEQGISVIDVALDEGAQPYFIQAIPDLEVTNLWVGSAGGEGVLFREGLDFGGSVSLKDAPPGPLELRLGEGPDRPIRSYTLAESSGLTLIASFGTLDPWDPHVSEDLQTSGTPLPQLDGEGGLPLTCRAVNSGSIGACVERCDVRSAMDLGFCSGESMGCAPRFHEDRNRWTAICEPTGTREVDQGCDPRGGHPCAEGLYCEEVGDEAPGSARGICRPRCALSDGSPCDEGEVCRALTGAADLGIGECRRGCIPDESYRDLSCPPGRQTCKPEGSLVPTGDGISAGFDLQRLEPICWASGSTALGQACTPGNCEAGSECIFRRSLQTDLVSTLLSPYFTGGGAFPICQSICDPFTDQRGASCGDDETCLFNYPWNAQVGHCAEIVENLGIGESCTQPGMACGDDSICILDSGDPRCTRFCEFQGQSSGGYSRSTCPADYQCQPFVADIGICRIE